jgi:PAS domain S-box-containing protein
LRESEEKYRLISENAHDLIVILNEKLEAEYVNEQAYQKILGYSREDVIGKNRREYIHPDDYQNSVDILNEIFRKGEGTGEFRLINNNGEYIWVELKGRVFKDSVKCWDIIKMN